MRYSKNTITREDLLYMPWFFLPFFYLLPAIWKMFHCKGNNYLITTRVLYWVACILASVLFVSKLIINSEEARCQSKVCRMQFYGLSLNDIQSFGQQFYKKGALLKFKILNTPTIFRLFNCTDPELCWMANMLLLKQTFLMLGQLWVFSFYGSQIGGGGVSEFFQALNMRFTISFRRILSA